MGVFACGVDVDRLYFKITSLLKLKCSVADPLWCGAALIMTTSLISKLLDKLWQGNVTLMISLSLLCIHISEHIKQHAPFFRTTMPVHIGHVTDTLVQEGIENLQWPSRSPDMNPIEHFGDRMGRNVYKWNEVVTFDDLARALVDQWNNLEPRFLRKLVQGMPRRIRELHKRKGGHTCYWRQFLKRRWAWWHWLLVSNLSKISSETFLLITMWFFNKT